MRHDVLRNSVKIFRNERSTALKCMQIERIATFHFNLRIMQARSGRQMKRPLTHLSRISWSFLIICLWTWPTFNAINQLISTIFHVVVGWVSQCWLRFHKTESKSNFDVMKALKSLLIRSCLVFDNQAYPTTFKFSQPTAVYSSRVSFIPTTFPVGNCFAGEVL